MRKWTASAGALALVAASVVTAGPASPAPAGPIGYTLIRSDGGCELATLDITTGELTDLPSTPSEEACVRDLAVGHDGAVYGINQTGLGRSSASPGAVSPSAITSSDIQFVVFSADGTPSSSPVSFDDIPGGASLEIGGIAVGPEAIYIQAYLGEENTTCAAGVAVCLLDYDVTTGLATPIGGSGLEEQILAVLADCASAQYTFLLGGPRQQIATSDRTTGAVSPGAFLSDLVFGADCAGGGDTLYAVAGPPAGADSTPLDFAATVGVLDPRTGEYTVTAAVSDPAAVIQLLAVGPVGTPTTPTTPTTTPPPAVAPADDATVAPAFTG